MCFTEQCYYSYITLTVCFKYRLLGLRLWKSISQVKVIPLIIIFIVHEFLDRPCCLLLEFLHYCNYKLVQSSDFDLTDFYLN